MRELFPSENPLQSPNSHPNKKNLEKLNPHSLQARKIWDYICEELYSHLGDEACRKWIFPIRAHASNEDELVLIVPSVGFYQVILSEYLEIIERCKNKLGFEHVSTVIDLDREPSPTGTPASPKDRSLFVENLDTSVEAQKGLAKNKKIRSQKEDHSLEPPSLQSENNNDANINISNISGTYSFNRDHPSVLKDPNFSGDHTHLEDQGFHENSTEALIDLFSGNADAILSSEKHGSDLLFSHSLTRKTKLNPHYTFDTFVRGPSNQFALAACYNVAENLGKTYNPLFIYGATGLGKTHLLHAVGNHMLKTNPNAMVAYISSERFMNELIYCLRHNKIIDFRQKYRHCDLFLMDDIQFISGNKAATQEEFFHTFNTLYEAKKQIIITSDLFPQDIPDIEERLRNRFQWGLIADIQAPDIEHRIAILYSKAEQLGVRLSLDVAEYIANFVKRNVRELEGALHRLAAFAALHGRVLDKSLAIETFSSVLSEDSTKPHLIDAVQKVVAEHFEIRTSDLKSKKRHKALTLPRQIAMYLCRKFTKTSYPEIGEKFGGKDHTTVMHAVRKITLERKKNMALIVHLDALERMIERLR